MTKKTETPGEKVANARVTPEMEAGLSDHVWSLDELISLL